MSMETYEETMKNDFIYHHLQKLEQRIKEGKTKDAQEIFGS